MKPTFEEMYQECVQHYIDKGYSPDHAADYVASASKEIIPYIFEWIQEEN